MNRAVHWAALFFFCAFIACEAERARPALSPEATPQSALPASAANIPSRGPVNAPVVLQVFSDFECPFCADIVATLDQLEREFPGRLRIVWRNLPLPAHGHARLAAAAALEAHAQRGNAGFWQMHDLIWQGAEPNRAALTRYAQKLGLDGARFSRALDDKQHDAAIDRDIALADATGIPATPTCIINGQFVVGAQPIEEFRAVVERALSAARTQPRPH
ncbi:MAG TPA: thioredoxin domain-containing protein [Polyangiaceae bacterium]|nr:thioredoxin domain-containing protein [Polyangiaceae bacterium]